MFGSPDSGMLDLFHLSDRKWCILPYRPLPFLAGISAQMRAKQVLLATRKLLMGANFPMTLEKFDRRKINSPSRHHLPATWIYLMRDAFDATLIHSVEALGSVCSVARYSAVNWGYSGVLQGTRKPRRLFTSRT